MGLFSPQRRHWPFLGGVRCLILSRSSSVFSSSFGRGLSSSSLRNSSTVVSVAVMLGLGVAHEGFGLVGQGEVDVFLDRLEFLDVLDAEAVPAVFYHFLHEDLRGRGAGRQAQ